MGNTVNNQGGSHVYKSHNDCGAPCYFFVPELSFSVGANDCLADINQDGDVIAEYGGYSTLLFRAGRNPLKFKRILDFFLKFRADQVIEVAA